MQQLLVGVSLVLSLIVACASSSPRPHRDLAAVWRDYEKLPSKRALAIAGDPERDHWVVGSSGGHASFESAEDEALAQCRIRRKLRRLQEQCVLYAVGDEIIWRGR